MTIASTSIGRLESLLAVKLFDRSRKGDMVNLDAVERLRVDSHRSSLAVSLDGEVVRVEPPLDYKIRKKALRVIAP